jgi:hypothetical protein
VILASPTGPFGLLDAAGRRRPIRAVPGELAAAAGSERITVNIDGPGIAAVAFRRGGATRILAANLTDQPIPLALPQGFGEVGQIGKTGELTKPARAGVLDPYRTHIFST